MRNVRKESKRNRKYNVSKSHKTNAKNRLFYVPRGGVQL